MFRAPAMLMPHESTVAHEQRFVLEPPNMPHDKPELDEETEPDAITAQPKVWPQPDFQDVPHKVKFRSIVLLI